MTASVSVVIPTYNRQSYVETAIASVLAQTHSEFELIVVDDGSTDSTLEVLIEQARADSRMRIVENSGPCGPGGARNAGIAEARGDWVAFLDSDDVWEVDALATLLSAVRPGAVLVSGDYRLVHDSEPPRTMREQLFETMLPWWESHSVARQVVDCQRLREDVTFLGDRSSMIGTAIGGFLWLGTSSTMARRTDVNALGGFDAKRARTEDFDLWLRLSARGDVAFVDQVLASCDVGGRATGDGPRYETHGERAHDAYQEDCFQLDFLKTMPARATLGEAQRLFLAERISAARRRCGYAARKRRPLAAFWHYAAALLACKEQRKEWRRHGREYFQRRW